MDELKNYIEKTSRSGASYSFRGVHFTDVQWNQPPFHALLLSGDWDFSGAVFDQNANFSGVAFRKEIRFHDTHFRGQATFACGAFGETAHFIKTRFSGPASFNGTYFGGLGNFYEVIFESSVDFTCAKVRGHVWFNGAEPHRCFADTGDFSRIEFLTGGKLTFENVNLSKAFFDNSDLEQPHFFNVQWYHPVSSFAYRGAALWGEFSPEKRERKFEALAENYRQLVLNYERRRDYQTADWFHIGEMETRRKAPGAGARFGSLRRFFSLHNAYRLLSNYGTGIWHAFAVLLVVIAALSCLFLLTGFREAGGSEVIRYIPALRIPSRSLFHDWSRAVLLTISTATLQRDRPYELVGGWSHLVGSVGFIAVAAQTALLLLAIRRRFRR